MTLDYFRSYCLSKPGVTADFPFDENTLVLRVMGKIFSITDIDKFEFINLKCEPNLALELRESFDSVRPGWHMNKKHWNSVYLDGSLEQAQISEWIDHSYTIVATSLTKKLKQELAEL